MTLAKGLGGGVPIGAIVTFGERVRGLLTPGQHGTTFGGNPLAAASGLAVLDEIDSGRLLEHARETGDHFAAAVAGLGDERIVEVRGRGLLRAVVLRDEIAPALTVAAREAGFIVNPVAPNALRIAPPLIITTDQLDTFVSALPGLIDTVTSAAPATTEGA